MIEYWNRNFDPWAAAQIWKISTKFCLVWSWVGLIPNNSLSSDPYLTRPWPLGRKADYDWITYHPSVMLNFFHKPGLIWTRLNRKLGLMRKGGRGRKGEKVRSLFWFFPLHRHNTIFTKTNCQARSFRVYICNWNLTFCENVNTSFSLLKLKIAMVFTNQMFHGINRGSPRTYKEPILSTNGELSIAGHKS